MGGWTLSMVDIYICTKAINDLWVDSLPRPKSYGRGNPMCWHGLVVGNMDYLGGEYQVHRPLFTGRLGESAMFTDLTLQVAPVG